MPNTNSLLLANLAGIALHRTPNHQKIRFTDDQDEIIKQMASKCPSEQRTVEFWKKVAQQIPGKSAKQCRERYQNFLDPTFSKEWTEEEDRILIEAYNQLKSSNSANIWATISKQCLPKKSKMMIKNRYNTLVHKKTQIPWKSTLPEKNHHESSQPSEPESSTEEFIRDIIANFPDFFDSEHDLMVSSTSNNGNSFDWVD